MLRSSLRAGPFPDNAIAQGSKLRPLVDSHWDNWPFVSTVSCPERCWEDGHSVGVKLGGILGWASTGSDAASPKRARLRSRHIRRRFQSEPAALLLSSNESSLESLRTSNSQSQPDSSSGSRPLAIRLARTTSKSTKRKRKLG